MTRPLTPRWRLRATLASLTIPPLVHLVSLARLSEWIAPTARSRRDDASVDDRALAEWVDRVLRALPPPWRHTCLRRAVVLHHLLHRAGRPVELRIGVRRAPDNALAAHAWIVRDGAPYLEPATTGAAAYQVLATFPGERRP